MARAKVSDTHTKTVTPVQLWLKRYTGTTLATVTMPTAASIQRNKIIADLTERKTAGEDVVVHRGGAPHVMDGTNVVFVNHQSRFVCIQCYELFQDDQATYGFGGMTAHCASKCQAKNFVVLDPKTPYIRNNDNTNNLVDNNEGGGAEQPTSPVVKQAWSVYCTENLFLPGGGLHTKTKLEEYIANADGPFFFNTAKPTKDDYKLLVRNTPPHFDLDHPFWTTM